jgi:acyl dehydratase
MKSWNVTAVNLPEHADNPIHTDAGAQAAGFPRALVAGVTTYAYLTHPAVAASSEWVRNGAAELRLLSPVFDGDEVICTPTVRGGESFVEALVNGEAKATLRLLDSPKLPAPVGEELVVRRVHLADGLDDYGTRAGDDLACYPGIIHPCVWPSLANRVFHEQLVRGSWVHTRSIIQHHDVAYPGETVDIRATVLHRFTKPTGERAVALVQITREGHPIATLEHEAIIALPGV